VPGVALALDVDTGIDDALAILYAVAHQGIDVTAITGVSGNVGLAQVMHNTCQVLEVGGGQHIPVAAGARQSLTGGGPRIGHGHGANGLGGVVLPPPVRAPDPAGAVELLRAQIVRARHPVTLVALAPQTNVATVLATHPHLAGRLERIVFVGGRIAETNPPAPAEFNVGHDPEAVAAVLRAGVPITMYGLDVFDQVVVTEVTARRLSEHPHPAVRLAGQLLLVRRGRLIGDAGALVMLTNPELFEVKPLPIRMGLMGHERGQTLVSDPNSAAATVIDVVLGVDAAQAAKAFISVINGYAA
jgi:pyrimidine-specific ribonucleoside hydrolase